MTTSNVQPDEARLKALIERENEARKVIAEAKKVQQDSSTTGSSEISELKALVAQMSQELATDRANNFWRSEGESLGNAMKDDPVLKAVLSKSPALIEQTIQGMRQHEQAGGQRLSQEQVVKQLSEHYAPFVSVESTTAPAETETTETKDPSNESGEVPDSTGTLDLSMVSETSAASNTGEIDLADDSAWERAEQTAIEQARTTGGPE